MAEADLRTVGEDEQAAGGVELVREVFKDTAAEAFKVFEVGLADLAEEEAFEAGDALAIVGAELGEEPVGFAAAAGAAIADGLGAVGLVAKPGGSAGGELAILQDDTGVGEVEELVAGTAVLEAELEEVLQLFRPTGRERFRCVFLHREIRWRLCSPAKPAGKE